MSSRATDRIITVGTPTPGGDTRFDVLNDGVWVESAYARYGLCIRRFGMHDLHLRTTVPLAGLARE